MNNNIVNRLPLLKPPSEKTHYLPQSITDGLRADSTKCSTKLIKHRQGPDVDHQVVWFQACAKEHILQHTYRIEKVMTIDNPDQGFPAKLNKELLGGESYPVWSAIIGTVSGLADGVGALAGVLYSLGSTTFDYNRRTTNVLARNCDEIWHLEQIGKMKNTHFFSSDEWVAVHIDSYILYDPFRGKSPQKGWLLGESRQGFAIE